MAGRREGEEGCCSEEQRILDGFLHEVCHTAGRSAGVENARAGRLVQMRVRRGLEEVYLEQVGLDVRVRRVEYEIQLRLDGDVGHVIVAVHDVTDVDDLLRQNADCLLAGQTPLLLVVEFDQL